MNNQATEIAEYFENNLEISAVSHRRAAVVRGTNGVRSACTEPQAHVWLDFLKHWYNKSIH